MRSSFFVKNMQEISVTADKLPIYGYMRSKKAMLCQRWARLCIDVRKRICYNHYGYVSIQYRIGIGGFEGIMIFRETVVFPCKEQLRYRYPSVLVTSNGTVLAFCDDRRDEGSEAALNVALVTARKKPGRDWEPIKTLCEYPGWRCGVCNSVYDPDTDTVICFVKKGAFAVDEWKKCNDEYEAEFNRKTLEKVRTDCVVPGHVLFCSMDNGETWSEYSHMVEKVDILHIDGKRYSITPFMVGSANGLMLKQGRYRGRLVCPARFTIGAYKSFEEIRDHAYNNCIYSDDHGVTWRASKPVQIGTGEGCIIERSDGTLLYNSRAYFGDTKRRMAISRDGGETWGEFYNDDFLMEDAAIGCNASCIRIPREELSGASALPDGVGSVTVFTNPRAKERKNMSVSISYDEGKTWVKVKTVWAKGAAYSSIAYNPVDGLFYLMYERGEENPYGHGIAVAEFDLEWLLSDSEREC